MAGRDRRNGRDIHGVPADWKRYSNTSDNHSLPPLLSLSLSILPPLSVVQTDLISRSLSAGWLVAFSPLSSRMRCPSPPPSSSYPASIPPSLSLCLSLSPPQSHDVFWSFSFSDKTGTELQRFTARYEEKTWRYELCCTHTTRLQN